MKSLQAKTAGAEAKYCIFTNANINLPLNGSFMQGGIVPVVTRVGISTLPHQQLDNLSMAKAAGIMQGNEPTVIPGMHIGTTLQKVINHIFTAKAWNRQ